MGVERSLTADPLPPIPKQDNRSDQLIHIHVPTLKLGHSYPWSDPQAERFILFRPCLLAGAMALAPVIVKSQALYMEPV